MSIDDDIDELYRGPLEAFTEQRNALAKSARRPDVKALQKPSVPAWAVNQLFWHHRAVVDRLTAASEAVREQHRRALAGQSADVRSAEQAHREALREAQGAARDVLAAGQHALTPATLEAVRDTLQALPAPEAHGRLVRALTPRGLEALAGLVLAARPGPMAAPPPVAAPTATRPPGGATSAPSPDANARARAARAAEKAAEKAAKARQARREKAEAVLAAARGALDKADAAVEQAERDLARRQAERIAAREAVKRAQRAVEELSFGR